MLAPQGLRAALLKPVVVSGVSRCGCPGPWWGVCVGSCLSTTSGGGVRDRLEGAPRRPAGLLRGARSLSLGAGLLFLRWIPVRSPPFEGGGCRRSGGHARWSLSLGAGLLFRRGGLPVSCLCRGRRHLGGLWRGRGGGGWYWLVLCWHRSRCLQCRPSWRARGRWRAGGGWRAGSPWWGWVDPAWCPTLGGRPVLVFWGALPRSLGGCFFFLCSVGLFTFAASCSGFWGIGDAL